MEKVQDILKEISSNITQATGSKKDEIAVAKAMLNDKSYNVGVYTKEGKIGTYNPSSAMRHFAASTLSKAAKIPSAEANMLMDNYEFGKAEAEDVIGFSKEFVHTYLNSGRKLPLGGRENSDVALTLKHVEAGKRRYPMVVGIDDAGKKITKPAEKFVPSYEAIKSISPCPSWVRDKKTKK